MQNSREAGAVNSEALARARYFAYSQKRTMPPRCNPFSILFMVLSMGMIFVGLTFTIIANWPGSTTIGDNPLRIAGPVLFAVGVFLLIVGAACAAYLNVREQSKWETKLTNLAADRLGSSSREVLVQRPAPIATDERPYNIRPNERNVPAAGRYENQRDDPQGSSRSSGTSAIKGRYSSSTVDMLPDPNRKSEEFDRIDKIPDPMRIQKKRQTPKKSENSSGSANESYSSGAGEADLGVPGMLMPRRSPNGNGRAYANDVYEDTERVYEIRQRTSEASPYHRPHHQRAPKEGRVQQHTAEGVVDPIREAIKRGTEQVYAKDQQLRVHIKTQKGAAVHITPTATPPHMNLSFQKLSRHSLNTSAETEI